MEICVLVVLSGGLCELVFCLGVVGLVIGFVAGLVVVVSFGFDC